MFCSGACFVMGQQVDLMLPLLLLQPEVSSWMTEFAIVVKEHEDSPERPEPPELIVVGAGARLPAVVTTLISRAGCSLPCKALKAVM